MPFTRGVTEEDITAIAADLGLSLDEDSLARALEYATEIDEEFGVDADADRREPSSTGRLADDEYNALLHVYEEPRRRDTDGPLAGLRMVVKDNMAARDLTMTCGSREFEYVPSFDATVVGRLLEAGATLVGKSNMDAFAFGPAGQWSEFGRVENPLDAERVPGGSSSGSGAAVAGGLVDAALGSDSGGSVRSPAACCGIVGMKPTHGLVPRDGLVDLIPSTDAIGPLAPDVETAGRVLEAIAGPTRRDYSAMHADPGDLTDLTTDASYTVGLIEDTLELADDDVAERVRRSVERFDDHTDHSVEYVDLSFGEVDYAFSIVIGAEVAWLLRQRFAIRGQGTGYEQELREALTAATFNTHIGERIAPGALLDAETDGRAYVEARSEAARFRGRVEALFEDVDILLTPTLRMLPPEHGEVQSSKEGLKYGFTKPFSLTVGPAVSVPVDDIDGLPVSMQVIGAPMDDRLALQIASAFEDVAV